MLAPVMLENQSSALKTWMIS